MGKSEGQTALTISLVWLLILLLVLLCAFRVQEYTLAGAYAEDALAAANLASAVIDIKEYGRSHSILVRDPASAYFQFRDALGYNLQLDEDGNSGVGELFAGTVEVLQYIVYNVREENVEIFCFDGSGVLCAEQTGQRGSVRTPDGILVESTTIYSRIGFRVPGLLSQTIYAEKEKSVDIVRNE